MVRGERTYWGSCPAPELSAPTPRTSQTRLPPRVPCITHRWLQKAIAAAYKDAAQLATDKDLDSLRDRPDFQALLTSLKPEQANQSP